MYRKSVLAINPSMAAIIYSMTRKSANSFGLNLKPQSIFGHGSVRKNFCMDTIDGVCGWAMRLPRNWRNCRLARQGSKPFENSGLIARVRPLANWPRCRDAFMWRISPKDVFSLFRKSHPKKGYTYRSDISVTRSWSVIFALFLVAPSRFISEFSPAPCIWLGCGKCVDASNRVIAIPQNWSTTIFHACRSHQGEKRGGLKNARNAF